MIGGRILGGCISGTVGGCDVTHWRYYMLSASGWTGWTGLVGISYIETSYSTPCRIAASNEPPNSGPNLQLPPYVA